MKLDRVHDDLDLNHDKWRADGDKLVRDISKNKYGNSTEKLTVRESGNLVLDFKGENELQHFLKLGFLQRRFMRGAVARWKERLTDQVFSRLGQADPPPKKGGKDE